MSTPPISVIMPVYNAAERYLREAIESILSQSFQDFEFLIVDDCSTDPRVHDTIRSYQDPRIRFYIQPQNKGAAATRNRALEEAKGTFIAFLDCDDVAHPTRLQKQYDFLNSNPHIGIVGSSHIYIPANKPSPAITGNDAIRACTLFNKCSSTQSSMMLRKELLDTHNIRYREDTIPSEDYALWLDAMDHTVFDNLPEYLLKYRWHGENLSIKQADKQIRKNRELIIEKWQQVFSLPTNDTILPFLGLEWKNADRFAEIEAYFYTLLAAIDKGDVVVPSLARHYLGQMYKRTLRKYPSASVRRAMLASPLAKELKLNRRFKLAMYAKSLFPKGDN